MVKFKPQKYDHKKVEPKWQKRWEKKLVYSSPDMVKVKKAFYNLWMFPYPSAEGVHAGTIFSSTGSDVYGRYMRMVGKEVFQPIGYDSFGIHSENYAIKIGESPQEMLARTLVHYQNQFKQIGHGYDWQRTVTTSDIDYYRWTQWLFVELFKAGLAYRKKSEVNFCPSCKTVLADEQVMTPAQAGKDPKDAKGNIVKTSDDLRVCERCGTVVERKTLEQWMFRITNYADQLLKNLGKINWPEKIKIGQENWIGKKQGINISYPIKDSKIHIEVWTSRPDTNFGATFIVISPEHPQVLKITDNKHKKEVSEYIEKVKSRSKYERIAEGRKKTGVFTGSYAINQINGYEMPIWVADFVLMDVGTGAVVGVPGHDLRDFEFAKEFGLSIKRVVVGADGDTSEIKNANQVQEDEGGMVNSEFLNGMNIHKATVKMMDYLEDKGWGKRETNYHLRDWIISRQRYWGAPIPMIYCQKCADEGRGWLSKNKPKLNENQEDWEVAGWYPEENLPVELPQINDYKPKGNGKGPLDDHPEFYETTCPACGADAKRETDVSDTFLDSSWYFIAYPLQSVESWKKGPQANSGKQVIGSQITKNWLPVNLYFGGAEHTVLHLMYARFVTMVLNDLGYIDFDEPFPWFYAHGLMIKDGAKMSKSRGNVVNPDEYIEKFGADALRLYLMFMGPMDGYPDFRDTGIEGMRRFVDRIWDLVVNVKNFSITDKKQVDELSIRMHQTIKKVSEDIQEFKYNTAIAAIMEYVNLLRATTDNLPAKSSGAKYKGVWNSAINNLVLLLAPFMPHMAEEMWCEVLGNKFSVHKASWPKFDPKMVKEQYLTIPVQVNGKLRATLEIAAGDAEDKEAVVSRAKNTPNVKKWLDRKEVVNTIFVAGKLVNFVVK